MNRVSNLIPTSNHLSQVYLNNPSCDQIHISELEYDITTPVPSIPSEDCELVLPNIRLPQASPNVILSKLTKHPFDNRLQVPNRRSLTPQILLNKMSLSHDDYFYNDLINDDLNNSKSLVNQSHSEFVHEDDEHNYPLKQGLKVISILPLTIPTKDITNQSKEKSFGNINNDDTDVNFKNSNNQDDTKTKKGNSEHTYDLFNSKQPNDLNNLDYKSSNNPIDSADNTPNYAQQQLQLQRDQQEQGNLDEKNTLLQMNSPELQKKSTKQKKITSLGINNGTLKDEYGEKRDSVDIFKQETIDENVNRPHPLSKILMNIYWVIFMQLLTITVLFIDDIRTLVISSDGDIAVDLLLFIAVVLFTLEIILTWISSRDYRCSFFFYMDLISTLTIPIDSQIFKTYVFQGNIFANSAQIARASRVSRLGIRVARIIRFIKLIRLSKFLKNINEVKNKQDQNRKEKVKIEIMKRMTVIEPNPPKKLGTFIAGKDKNNIRRNSIVADSELNAENNNVTPWDAADKLVELQKNLGIDNNNKPENVLNHKISKDEDYQSDESISNRSNSIINLHPHNHPNQHRSRNSSTKLKQDEDNNVTNSKSSNKDIEKEKINNFRDIGQNDKDNNKNDDNTANKQQKEGDEIIIKKDSKVGQKLLSLRTSQKSATDIQIQKPIGPLIKEKPSLKQFKPQIMQLVSNKIKKSRENSNLDNTNRDTSRPPLLADFIFNAFYNPNHLKSLRYLKHINPGVQFLTVPQRNRLQKSKTIIPSSNSGPTFFFPETDKNKPIQEDKPNNENADNAEDIEDYNLVYTKEEQEIIEKEKKKTYDEYYKSEAMFMVDELPKESRVGRALSESTIKSVIIIVLVLLFTIPIFDINSWTDVTQSFEYDLMLLDEMYNRSYTYNLSILTNDPNSNTNINSINNGSNNISSDSLYEYKLYLNQFIQFYTGINSDYNYPLICLVDTLNNMTLYQTSDFEDLRIAEEATLYETYLSGTFSLKSRNKLESLLNVCRTVFICVILMIGTLFFNKDSQEQVLIPLERMIQKVNYLATSHFVTGNLELLQEEEESGNVKETAILENAITKIATLLSIGFGEAGSRIITQNIRQGGDVEPFLSGTKVLAIFGFCDIRNFTDVTEILEQDVMVFVNSIAQIIHNMADRYLGQANKNIGDAFLLVWKFPLSEIYEDEEGNLSLLKSNLVINLGDLAVISFLRMIAKIHTSPVLKFYRENQAILKRLPNYQVKMGFGLDQGWAIEGAIGSEYKIDASYLSPHVNLSSRMEAATKQYGVPVLITQNLYHILSSELKKICRKIDVVTVKGSKFPIEIYTIDVKPERLDVRRLSKKGDSQTKHDWGSPLTNSPRGNGTNRSSQKMQTAHQIPQRKSLFANQGTANSPVNKMKNNLGTHIGIIERKKSKGNHSPVARASLKNSNEHFISCSNCNIIGISEFPCEHILAKLEIGGSINCNVNQIISDEHEITGQIKMNLNNNCESYKNISDPSEFQIKDDGFVHSEQAVPKQEQKSEKKIKAELPKKIRQRRRQAKKIDLFENILEGKEKASKFMSLKVDLKKMIIINEEFTEVWNRVMISYIGGNWSLAERLLKRVESLRPNDGPTKTLYSYIKERNFVAPNDWPGYRELLEKQLLQKRFLCASLQGILAIYQRKQQKERKEHINNDHFVRDWKSVYHDDYQI